jgi:hypothetical protein
VDLKSLPVPQSSLAGDGGALHRIDIGATFLTGVHVDMDALRREDAATAIEGAHPRCDSSCAEPCNVVPLQSQRRRGSSVDGTFYGISGADHGSEVIAYTLACVDSDWLLSRCDGDAAPPGWRLSSAQCDLHDFGVGMIVLSWDPVDVSSTDVGDLPMIVDDLGCASRQAIGQLAAEIAAGFAGAMNGYPGHREELLSDVLPGELRPEIGQVLWLWHLLCLSAAANADHATIAEAVAGHVCPNGFRLLRHRDHSFAAGVHASVSCSRRGREEDAAFLARAPRLQDAWWTLFWRLDRELFELQLQLARKEGTSDLEELRGRADRLADLSSQLDLYRSRLDSMLVAGGARDLDAWNLLATAWDLPYRIAAVDRKIQLLGRAHTEVIEQTLRVRTARISFMIYVFAAISVVASVVATIQYSQGDVDVGLAVRLAVVAASVLAALVAVLLSRRRRTTASTGSL